MRVLVLGADGFIGRHIAFGLRAAGHEVLAHARRPGRLAQMGFETLALDLTDPRAADPAVWAPHLTGVQAVVNSAGVLAAPEAVARAVHVTAPAALYAALPGGARGVLISAVGIDGADTAFARMRREGEAVAQAHGLTVLRAGLVLGETSYGGSSLARALAACPLVIPVVGDGTQRFNSVHATALAGGVANALERPAPDHPVEIGGPETVTQAGMLQAYRQWLGLSPALLLRLPLPMARALGAVGDAMRLGPISRTAVAQLQSGVLANGAAGPGLSAMLAARPAGTQDLWHAGLYLLRPLLRIVLALLWLASGLLGLLLPPETFLPLIPSSPLPDAALIALARGGGLADLAIAAALLRGWRPRLMTGIQVAMVGAYTLAFTLLAPGLWLLPLGGLLKNLPILALLAVQAVLEDER